MDVEKGTTAWKAIICVSFTPDIKCDLLVKETISGTFAVVGQNIVHVVLTEAP